MIVLTEAMKIADVFASDKIPAEECEEASFFRGTDDLTENIF